MKRIALVNPNTNAATTALMVAIARQHARPGCAVEGVTAPSGAPLIINEDQLRMAADGVASMARSLAKQVDGVIVSAFGDPAVEALRKQLSMPVEGIAEPAMREAAAHGRRFAIVTTTPGLVRHMLATAHRLGFGPQLAAIRTTEALLEPLMRDSERLVDALEHAARLAMEGRSGVDHRRWPAPPWPSCPLLGGNSWWGACVDAPGALLLRAPALSAVTGGRRTRHTSSVSLSLRSRGEEAGTLGFTVPRPANTGAEFLRYCSTSTPTYAGAACELDLHLELAGNQAPSTNLPCSD